MEQVFEAGLDLLLAKDARKKALVAKPRPSKDPKLLRFDSRYVPAEIRREVWKRDQGRCQWWRAEGSAVRRSSPSWTTSMDSSQASRSQRRT
jgi:hypothetical protein